MSEWHLYLVRTGAGALYTGISTDVDKRFETHQLGRGSKYLRGKQSAELVYRCQIGDRSLTSKVEYRVKQLEKSSKENIVRSAPNRDQLLDLVELSD